MDAVHLEECRSVDAPCLWHKAERVALPLALPLAAEARRGEPTNPQGLVLGSLARGHYGTRPPPDNASCLWHRAERVALPLVLPLAAEAGLVDD